jgi:hypothetical protein
MQALSLAQFVVDGWKQLAQPKITYADGTVEEIPPAVRTRNLELIGKHLGMFVERVETKDTTDRSAEEIEAQIKARLGLSETAGGAGKKGGVYLPYPNGRGGAVAALSAPLRASRAAGGRTGCHDRVQCRGRMHGVMGCRGGSDRIGGAGGSTGKRHPVDPTHPHHPGSQHAAPEIPYMVFHTYNYPIPPTNSKTNTTPHT